MDQKSVFRESEGDAWFERNRQRVLARQLPDDDPLLRELLTLLPAAGGERPRVLEVGCGEGSRLGWLHTQLGAECHGIDPSAQAVAAARAKGVLAQHGTADTLPFERASFDFVIFGFCLYLCDRGDLFRIASEADRVLRTPGWLLLMDFHSPVPRSRPYHHRPGLRSYKMDYRTLFTWHPDYECMTHRVRHHEHGGCTDMQDDWVALSVLRKAPGDAPP